MLNIDSYKQQVDETTKKVLHILDDPGWVEKEKKTEITFYTRSVAGSSFNQIKSVVTIPTTLDKLYEELKKVVPVNDETPKEKRDGFLERCILSEIDEQTAFYYIALETSSRFVSPRDFLTIQRVIPNLDEKVILIRTSIIDDTIKPEVKGRVRGNMFFQAYIGEEENGIVKLSFLVHADPCGSVPAMIYNTVATKQGENALKIKKALMK